MSGDERWIVRPPIRRGVTNRFESADVQRPRTAPLKNLAGVDVVRRHQHRADLSPKGRAVSAFGRTGRQ
jgi:hypothetical protein